MALRIGKQYTVDDAIQMTLHHDETGLFTDPSDPEAKPAAGQVVFYLKPLTGRDHKDLADKMMKGDKKGEMKMMTGSTLKSKALRSVIGVEGLEYDDGRPVESFDGVVYDMLPSWVCEKLAKQIREINQDEDDDDEEQG